MRYVALCSFMSYELLLFHWNHPKRVIQCWEFVIFAGCRHWKYGYIWIKAAKQSVTNSHVRLSWCPISRPRDQGWRLRSVEHSELRAAVRLQLGWKFSVQFEPKCQCSKLTFTLMNKNFNAGLMLVHMHLYLFAVAFLRLVQRCVERLFRVIILSSIGKFTSGNVWNLFEFRFRVQI